VAKVCAIHQPDFFPWLGFFDKIKKSDIFVVLDDTQYPKKTASGIVYMNRVTFNIGNKAQWFTAPIERKSGTWNVNETYFVKTNWREKLKKTLQTNYAKSKNYLKYREKIFELIDFDDNHLVTYNLNAIKGLCSVLDIEFEGKYIIASDLEIQTSATQRLVDICEKVEANVYISGSGGKNYLDENLFGEGGIELRYNGFASFEYTQARSDDFIKGLSVIDYIFEAL
jgi:hypothetical protein